jgi:hypothetical protein
MDATIHETSSWQQNGTVIIGSPTMQTDEAVDRSLRRLEGDGILGPPGGTPPR